MSDFVIENGILKNYTGTADDVEIPVGVTRIDDYAFDRCQSLRSIVIPGSVINIGERSFFGCKNLQRAVIAEGVITIGNSAFSGCSNLQSVIIPNSVTEINKSAFHSCWNLQNVVIPESVMHIRDTAFYLCRNLQSIVIPKSVINIGQQAFYGCGLKNVMIEGEQNISLGGYAFSDCHNLQNVVILANINFKTYGNGAYSLKDVFARCESIAAFQAPGLAFAGLDIDAKLKTAMLRGFLNNPSVYAEDTKNEYVKYMNGQKKKLLSLAVSKGEVSIFETFEQLGIKLTPTLRDELIDLATKEEKTDVIAWLLDYKNRTADRKKEAKAKERTLEQQIANPYIPKLLKADWSWTKLENGTIQIDKYKGTEANVVIPPFVGDVPVTSIGGYAFVKETRSSWNTNTTTESIAIPESVSNISSFAFCGCSKLKKIRIPDHVTRIGYSTFESCDSLERIDIPTSVTSIGYNAFRFTPWGKNQGDMVIVNGILVRYQGTDADIVIPGHVTTIGEKAFEGCKNLKSVEIPDSVKYIGPNAFEGCGNLKNVKLPKEITCIEVGVFFGCKSLRSVEIPDGVISIERMAFCDCTNLKKIELSDSVTSVDFMAFRGCKNLKSISLPENVELEARWMPENTEIIRRPTKD